MQNRVFLLALSAISTLLLACPFEAIKTPGSDGCTKVVCAQIGATCGLVADGCGGVQDCGTCSGVEVCGSTGFDNICCDPLTCVSQGANCGTMSDSCGQVLNCGDCSDGESCGGGGPNICGTETCVAQTCEERNVNCNTLSDGCGGILDCGSCPEGETCGGSGQPNVCGTATGDNNMTTEELIDNCFDFPATPFSATNWTSLKISLDVGDEAPNFILSDLSGETHELHQLLDSKPVMLQTSSYTCPVYQRKISDSQQLASVYGDRVHFLIIYTPEAHPKTDPSPYKGSVWELAYSDYSQANTYDERAEAAAQVDHDGSQLLLVDDLAPRERNNPVWCTYGPAPNAAFLIGQDKKIHTAHLWFDPATMRTSIEELL